MGKIYAVEEINRERLHRLQEIARRQERKEEVTRPASGKVQSRTGRANQATTGRTPVFRRARQVKPPANTGTNASNGKGRGIGGRL